jgi:hypothetical protein
VLAPFFAICLPCPQNLPIATLKWLPPLKLLTGQTQDTSTLMVCAIYEPVYYNPHYNGFPSNPNEELGHWVGVATNVGDTLTFKLLTSNQMVIFRFIIWSSLDPTICRKNLVPLGGEQGTNHASALICIPQHL